MYTRSGYYQPYTIARPEDMADDETAELIAQLKASIEGSKLADLRSTLSKLKLAINEQYPGFTELTAPFSAYVYAKEGGYKKAVDSLFKANIKMNFSFQGKAFPLKDLFDTMTPSQIQIIFDDFLNNPDFKWNIQDEATANLFYDKYPKEADTCIEKGRLSIYTVRNARVAVAIAVIKNGSENAILSMFNTLYGESFLKSYTFSGENIRYFLSALDIRSKELGKKIRKEYFYTTAARSIHLDFLAEEIDNGNFDEELIKVYTDSLTGPNGSTINVAMEVIKYLSKAGDKYKKLKDDMVASNEILIGYIATNFPEELPQDVLDIFVF